VFPNMTNAQIETLLFNTAVNIHVQNPSIPQAYLGHGRVDAHAAMVSLYPALRITASSLNDSAGGDGDGRLEAGETARLYLTVMSTAGWANGDSISAVVSADDSNLTINNGAWYIGHVPSGQSVNNQASPVLITAASSLDTAYWRDIHVTFSAPTGYEETQSVTIRVGRGRVLVVDDDGTANYEQYYVTAASQAGVSSDLWSVSTSGDLPLAEMNQYGTLIWSCGDQSTSTLTSSDQTNLASYLDAGNNLILVGQKIDEDLRATPFYANYLHAQSENLTGDRQLSGIAGNPISDGMSLLLAGGNCAGNGNLSPSRILPVGGGEATFSYSQGGTGAVQFSGTFKVAYFAFALEAACGSNGTNTYADVIRAGLNWMGTTSFAPRQHPVLPTSVVLHANYPNPFNPSTTISVDLSSSSHVILRVFDVLGRSVATLSDERLAAGSHEVSFDGKDLASGIYFVRLQDGAVTRSSKMILMK